MGHILAIVFGVVALGALGAAWIKRSKRVPFGWAAISAGLAASASYFHSFWPIPVFGLMTLWALFSATNLMAMAWRLKVGLTLALALGAGLAIYPTYHDEVMCSDKKPVAELRPTCPRVIDAMEPEAREQLRQAARHGDRGLAQFLLQNIPFRMVRGLDLKGGLRLVYQVQVDEAIRDKRDRYYDALRAGLTKGMGLSTSDNPTVAEMKKLDDRVLLRKPRDKTDTVVVDFKDPADAKAHITDAFLATFLGELTYLRAADGKTLTFRIRNEVGADIRDKAVSQAKETIHRRVDGLGVKEAAISVRDEDIIVEVPGEDEREFEKIRDIISETARLEFKLLEDEVNFFEKQASAAAGSLPKGLRFEIENAPLGKTEGGSTRTQPNYYARLDKLESESLEETLKRFREWTGTIDVDQDHEVGFGRVWEIDPKTEQYKAVGWRTYYLKAKAELTGDMVRDALATSDRSDTGLGGWYVNMTMTPLGAELFQKITGENVKRRFATILDGKVESAPVIQEEIGGGTARITMGAGGVQQQLEDARKLELVLRAGALPAPISPSNEQRVGASLGEDSIGRGVRAALVGGLLVLVMMILSYKQASFIANLAVMFNLMLQIAILAMFGASMTLPGIAGLALTLGMAVDANVLINERIREELAMGKTGRAAIATGYDKAFSAIIDGNATTLIAALILAQYGTGPIKGFAVTLIIGMITNLFTGVVVTRLLFEAWVKVRRDSKFGLGA